MRKRETSLSDLSKVERRRKGERALYIHSRLYLSACIPRERSLISQFALADFNTVLRFQRAI